MLFFISFFFSFFTQHDIGINVIYYRWLPSSGKSAANFSPQPPTRWWDGRQDNIIVYYILLSDCCTVYVISDKPCNTANIMYISRADKDRPKVNSIVFASKTGKRVRFSRRLRNFQRTTKTWTAVESKYRYAPEDVKDFKCTHVKCVFYSISYVYKHIYYILYYFTFTDTSKIGAVRFRREMIRCKKITIISRQIRPINAHHRWLIDVFQWLLNPLLITAQYLDVNNM